MRTFATIYLCLSSVLLIAVLFFFLVALQPNWILPALAGAVFAAIVNTLLLGYLHDAAERNINGKDKNVIAHLIDKIKILERRLALMRAQNKKLQKQLGQLVTYHVFIKGPVDTDNWQCPECDQRVRFYFCRECDQSDLEFEVLGHVPQLEKCPNPQCGHQMIKQKAT